MSGPGNVDSWFEFIVWTLIAGGSLVGAVAAVCGARHGQANRVATDEVREQVSNVDRVDQKVDQVDTKVDRLTGSFEAFTRSVESFMRESRAAQARQDRIVDKHHPGEP